MREYELQFGLMGMEEKVFLTICFSHFKNSMSLMVAKEVISYNDIVCLMRAKDPFLCYRIIVKEPR